MRSSSLIHPIARAKLGGGDDLGALEPADSASAERNVSSNLRPAVAGSDISTSPAAISGKIAVDRTAAPHRKLSAATPNNTGKSTCRIRPMPLLAQPNASARRAVRKSSELKDERTGKLRARNGATPKLVACGASPEAMVNSVYPPMVRASRRRLPQRSARRTSSQSATFGASAREPRALPAPPRRVRRPRARAPRTGQRPRGTRRTADRSRRSG